MKYSKDDYDNLAKKGTFDQIQTLHYENKIILAKHNGCCLLKSLFKINRIDELMYWIFEIEIDESMIISTQEGNLELVKHLIDKGANIHAFNDSALRWASINGHLNIVKYFIENGANIHTKNNSVLQYASIHGHLNIVKYLTKNGVNIHYGNDCSMQYAFMMGRVDIMKHLYSQDPEYYDEMCPGIVDKIKLV